MSDHVDLVECDFDRALQLISSVQPKLADLIKEIRLPETVNKNALFYVAEYTYGHPIINRGKFCEHSHHTNYDDALGISQRELPLGLSLERNLEITLKLNNLEYIVGVINKGNFFGLFELIEDLSKNKNIQNNNNNLMLYAGKHSLIVAAPNTSKIETKIQKIKGCEYFTFTTLDKFSWADVFSKLTKDKNFTWRAPILYFSQKIINLFTLEIQNFIYGYAIKQYQDLRLKFNHKVKEHDLTSTQRREPAILEILEVCQGYKAGYMLSANSLSVPLEEINKELGILSFNCDNYDAKFIYFILEPVFGGVRQNSHVLLPIATLPKIKPSTVKYIGDYADSIRSVAKSIDTNVEIYSANANNKNISSSDKGGFDCFWDENEMETVIKDYFGIERDLISSANKLFASGFLVLKEIK